MTARFHINSIDQEALALEGYKISLVVNGEVISINANDGTELVVGEPAFERILTACMNKPRLANIGGDDNSGMSEG